MRRKKKYECTAVEITKCWNVPVHTFIRKNSSISESSIRDEHKKMIGGYKKFCTFLLKNFFTLFHIFTETLTAVPNTLTQQWRCYHAGHLQQTDNRPIWRHKHTWTSPQNIQTPLPCNTRSTTVTQPWYHDQLKWTTWNTYVQNVSKSSQQRKNIISTGRTIALYTERWKCYLCGMDFFKCFDRSVHSATEHPDAPVLTPHTSLGDL